MFGQIFDIDGDGKVFLLDKSIALCPKLFEVYKHKRMGSDAVRWIVAVYDYKSPYRHLPLTERITEVTQKFYEKSDHYITKDPLMIEAIEEYIKLQYNPLIDQYIAMREKMVEKTNVYRNMPVDEKNLESINDMEIGMQKSAEALEKQKQLIKKDLEDGMKIQGSSENDLSFLETRELLKNK